MATKFEIVSQAFISIDASVVQSFDGDDPEEIWASNSYERIKQDELSNYQWNFNINFKKGGKQRAFQSC